jgi:hypothetical protein
MVGKENSMTHPDPDEVMKMVEAELALKRAKREKPSSRNAFRIWSLVIIIAAVIAGLFFLEFLVSQIPKPNHNPTPTPEETAPK